MDEPASALDPISTTRIEDLMHELKREYTIVIVTHNMQQAARVADMTAFFSVDVAPERRQAHRHPRRVRPHGEDLHDPGRQADGGLRDGAVRVDAGLVPGGARRARGVASRRGRARAALAARRGRGRVHAGPRARRRGDRLRRRHRRAVLRDRAGDRAAARAPDAGRERPPARARAPEGQPPPRADGRPLRHDREADEADEGACRPTRRCSRGSRRWASAPSR